MHKKILFLMSTIIVMLMLLVSCSNSNLLTDSVDSSTVVENIDDSVSEVLNSSDRGIGEKYPTTSTSNCYPYSKTTWGTSTWPRGVRRVYVSTTGYYYFEFGVYAPNATKVLLEYYGASTTYQTGYNAMYWYNMA